MKYEVKFTSRFKKDLKSIQKPNSTMKRFWDAIEMLANEMPLPDEFDDHKLVGNFIGVRECHIRPDWLLIYKV